MANYTPRAQQVITLAKSAAKRLKDGYVGSEHLLIGIIETGDGKAFQLLESMGVTSEKINEVIEMLTDSDKPKVSTSENLPYTPRTKKILDIATKEAQKLNHPYVGTEHILLGLLSDREGVALKIFKELDIDLDEAKEKLLEFVNESKKPEETAAGNVDDKKTKTPALKSFGRDLTEAARNNELDPVIGRYNEIERVIQILCRRTKNNPVLLGEAGVGKTAVAEGLAQKIVEGNVPELLKNKRIVTIDLALMIAGTKYRGQFEERLKNVMAEIKKAKNVIVFIDELHTMVGAGSAEGTMDASNMLKPALSRGEFQCVGATTLNEYRKYIEKDAALERRFQTVRVEEPSIEDAIQILKGIRHKFEAHHNAVISDEAVENAVKMSVRYINGRFLPDKAIDVIDEACARARIASQIAPANIRELESNLLALKIKKDEAIRKQQYEEAAAIRDNEKNAKEQMDAVMEDWKLNHKEKPVNVGEDEIVYTISKMTGVPLTKMNATESKRLLRMEGDLSGTVIGQETALVAVSKALRRSKTALKDPNRPIGTFLFLGPTGVGKTFLAQTLAEYMFGDKSAVIQIDMSEYMEKFNASRLIGSPPGYVGHDEGGQLSEAVRRKPYSVVLFDEIEKAHPDVLNMLLQITDEGRLTDSMGRKIDFRNTVVVMTSNVGADVLKKNPMGFKTVVDLSEQPKADTRMLEQAKKHFKPEFLNRLDEIVIFQSLGKNELHKIVELEVGKICKRLVEQKITIILDEASKDFLAEKGYDPQYGARPMRRAVEKHLEDMLAEAMIREDIRDGDTVNIVVIDGKLGINVKEIAV